VVVCAARVFDLPAVPGLPPKETALLTITFLVSAVTRGTGCTYMMQGAMHLVLFTAYLFLAFVP
jgi:Ca2+:H+ antiporter